MSAEWDDLARLAEAASKATHGLPWVKDPDAPDKVLASKDGGWDGSLVATVASDDFDLVEEDVTEFIAAANPATILRLITGYRAWQEEASEALGKVATWEQVANRIAAERDALAARLAAVEAELQQQRHRTAEFQTIAAGFANRAVAAEDRLAVVEVLSWELSPADGPRLRAALAAPTDTTKENR